MTDLSKKRDHQIPYPYVYLNGEFIRSEKAVVPVTDRGFLFGDGVYEVIPVFESHLFHLDDHIERLCNSLMGIKLTLPETATLSWWSSVLGELVKRNGGGDQAVYLQITRGYIPIRQHYFPEQAKPTILAMSLPLPRQSAETLREGVRAVVLPDSRWMHCSIKSIALLPNVLLAEEAKTCGAQEAILIRDGYVTEGATSNVFIVKGGIIYTPPKMDHLLGGITRDLVIQLAKQHGLPIKEQPVTEVALRDADEIWLTSSTREIRLVRQLDEQPITKNNRQSLSDTLWEVMIELYESHKKSIIQGRHNTHGSTENQPEQR